jgi:hypothetical protein
VPDPGRGRRRAASSPPMAMRVISHMPVITFSHDFTPSYLFTICFFQSSTHQWKALHEISTNPPLPQCASQTLLRTSTCVEIKRTKTKRAIARAAERHAYCFTPPRAKAPLPAICTAYPARDEIHRMRGKPQTCACGCLGPRSSCRDVQESVTRNGRTGGGPRLRNGAMHACGGMLVQWTQWVSVSLSEPQLPQTGWPIFTNIRETH